MINLPMGWEDPEEQEKGTFGQLVQQTKHIFQIIRQRRTILARHNNFESLEFIKQQHSRLIQQQKRILRRFPNIDSNSWGDLRSFFIRFRFRLSEIQQHQPYKTPLGGTADFIGGLDELIQEILQKSPVNTHRFFSYIFSFYENLVRNIIQSYQPKQPKITISSALNITEGTPTGRSNQYRRRPSLVRVLSCNLALQKAWMNDGRRNYTPLEVDPTLKQIYFFTRTQQQNAELMMEDMLARNKHISLEILQYEKQFKKYKKLLKAHSQSQKPLFRRRVGDYDSLESREISPEKPLKIQLPRQSINNRQLGRTMFRIRPQQQKNPKLSYPSNVLNQTSTNYSKKTVGTQQLFCNDDVVWRSPRKVHRPNTIKIEFRNIYKKQF